MATEITYVITNSSDYVMDNNDNYVIIAITTLAEYAKILRVKIQDFIKQTTRVRINQ